MGPRPRRGPTRIAVAAFLVAALLVAEPVRGDGPDAPPPPSLDADLRARCKGLADCGDLAGVLTAVEDALRCDPECATGWEYRAFALHRLGRLAEARDAYVRFTAARPDSAWGWAQLGAVENELGSPRTARSALDRAVALDPTSKDAWTKLVRLLRDLRDYQEALAAVERAATAKVDPAWCALECASVAWASGAGDAASRLDRAKALGADAEQVAHLRRLVGFDAALADSERRRFARGEPWRIESGPFVVETRVASRVPNLVGAVLAAAASRFPDWLDVGPTKHVELNLVLSRTLEEHEALRRAKYPGGAVGSAFTTSDARGRRFGRTVTMHACWAQPAVDRSVAHEAAHAFLRARGVDGAPWFDEAVACYLEGWALGESRGAARKDFVDLLDETRRAGRLLPWSGVTDAMADLFQRGDARLRYAQSWLLFHWMVHGDGGLGDKRVRALFATAGDPSRTQCAPLCATLGITETTLAAALDSHLTKLARSTK